MNAEEDWVGAGVEESSGGDKVVEEESSVETAENQCTAAAEAKAAKYKAERDVLHGMLLEEMARNVKLAEWLVHQTAKLSESLG